MKERYEELTDEIKRHQLSKYDITENKEAVYIEVLHIDPLDINLIDYTKAYPDETIKSNIKSVLLSGYAWRNNDWIYVEYLNLEGYLEKRIYYEYDFPKIYLRFK